VGPTIRLDDAAKEKIFPALRAKLTSMLEGDPAQHDDLFEYLTLLISNSRPKAHFGTDLEAFFGAEMASEFTEWLFTLLGPYIEGQEAVDGGAVAESSEEKMQKFADKISVKKRVVGDSTGIRALVPSKLSEQDVAAKRKARFGAPNGDAASVTSLSISIDNPNNKGGERDDRPLCSFWPQCAKGVNCVFHHPSTQCEFWPHCRFGFECKNLHPQVPCKFGFGCENPDCQYTHPHGAARGKGKGAKGFKGARSGGWSSRGGFSSRGSGKSGRGKGVANRSLNLAKTCRFDTACTEINCKFAHPERDANTKVFLAQEQERNERQENQPDGEGEGVKVEVKVEESGAT